MTMSAFDIRNTPSASAEGGIAVLEAVDVVKQFPGVLALDRVNFELKPGEVHVLFGENGAGKSTMISMIAGVHQPTSGVLKFKGKDVSLGSVHEARDLGISAVFQEFSLVDQLTVAENLFLGSEIGKGGFLDKKKQQEKAEEIITKLGFPLKAKTKVGKLSRAEQQMVEIAKAFRSELSVLILDEPTASLTDKETDQLFQLIEEAKSNGVGIIYITHRMAEIRKIADRITILRDGKYIDTVDAKTATEEQLVNLMTGRVVGEVFPSLEFTKGETLLKIDDVHTDGGRVNGASIHVQRGEIVGLAGLVGAGKSKLLRSCFGLEEVVSGSIIFNGEDVTNTSTKQMLDKGFYYIPPDRRAEGLVMVRDCRENITLSSLYLKQFRWLSQLLNRKEDQRVAQNLAERLQLHPLKISRQVDQFSGGNQQKVMLAKCLTRDVNLYVFDEPTVGVDVGTRVEIYKFIASLAASGAAVVVVSSDLPEVVNMSNRLYVMHRGKVQAELIGEDITQENVLKNFFDKSE